MKIRTKSKNRISGHSVFWTIVGIFLAVYAVSLFIPLIWGFISSFKGKIDFRLNMFGLPEEWLFSNYASVLKYFFIKVESGASFRNVYIPEMLLNSILYAVGSAFIQATVQFVMAYVAARFSKFKLSKIIYAIVIIGLIVPIVGSEASALSIAQHLNLKDRILGMYVMKSYFLGMYFLVFYETLKAFPKDYDEAARVDGASNLTIMLGIIAPLAKNTYFTIVLLLFVTYWNDYTTPMLFMPNVPTLSYGLYYFSDLSRINEVNTTPMRLGACMMMLVPTLTLFILFHNKLLSNITIGGVKE